MSDRPPWCTTSSAFVHHQSRPMVWNEKRQEYVCEICEQAEQERAEGVKGLRLCPKTLPKKFLPKK